MFLSYNPTDTQNVFKNRDTSALVVLFVSIMFGLFVSSAQSDVFSGNECDACCVFGAVWQEGGGEAVKASLFTPHKIPLFGFGSFF